MDSNKFPARLHILMATQSKKAIVIRLGPSYQNCILGWDRATNEFQVTQWFRGKIFTRRCDISPDGKHWIYFAFKANIGDSWTAIAKVPWLKAISLYKNGSTWGGGGLFLDNFTYWHHNIACEDATQLSQDIRPTEHAINFKSYGDSDRTIYFNRLIRDGWKIINRDRLAQDISTAIFEKQLNSNWIIQKICHTQMSPSEGKGGFYWDEHCLTNNETNSVTEGDTWEWAEWADDKLYFAKQGCLYQIDINDSGDLSAPELLHDFNHYTFEARTAPY